MPIITPLTAMPKIWRAKSVLMTCNARFESISARDIVQLSVCLNRSSMLNYPHMKKQRLRFATLLRSNSD
jgi:hypothetical protein